MDELPNFTKQYRKPASLITIFAIWSSIFSIIVSTDTGDFAFNLFQTVFAQNNQTEVGDIQKESLVRDESLQKQDTINDQNKLKPGIVTNQVPQNCGINPNAPPCCTPGEDEGCIGNDNKVSILQLGTNPQNLKSGDEFKVEATVVNNLDIPIKYTGDQCGGSPLDIQFDKNVNIYYAIACQGISTETLGTHETTTVQGKGNEILRAENPSKVNAQVTFNYGVEGDSTNQKQVTESFSFDILN
ncbi:MAG TPA: hypothetical protein VJL78_01300 [Candidatus Nitrosocosmicus sp.]|nr:hypothetical protein [Candidatus Nitrosocosmicus sp.]